MAVDSCAHGAPIFYIDAEKHFLGTLCMYVYVYVNYQPQDR